MFTRLAWALLAAPLAGCSAFGYPSPLLPPAPRSASAARDVAGTYEVFGVRYATLSSAEGYRERGLASWYGPQFDGQPTASGERYDMNAMTAAHRSLPLETCVEVKRLDTGARVVVRVNDRGPFVSTDQRIIDVSYAAAKKLDLVAPGTAPVELRALDDGDC